MTYIAGSTRRQRRAKDRPRSIFTRKRFQFASALVIAVLLPWWLRPAIGGRLLEAASTNAMIANMVAVAIAVWMRLSVEIYPGIRRSYVILPSASIAHAIVIVWFLLTRFPYDRVALAAGYVLHVCWLYLLYIYAERRVVTRIAVVPFGGVDRLLGIRGVEWLKLKRPKLWDARYCEAIVADFAAELPDAWEAFLADAALAGRIVYQHKQLGESLTGRVELEKLSENSFGSLVPSRAYFHLKSLVDFTWAVLILPAILPLMAIIAIAIRLDSSGPALFRQRRIGYAGRIITVYKFRTMRMVTLDDDERLAAMTSDEDERVTRVGKILRKLRIDELPQIFNILKWQMSWIGPRPEAEVLSHWYTSELPFYRYRHVVKPGISGWAQVNQGHVTEVDEVHRKLQYDFQNIFTDRTLFEPIRLLPAGHYAELDLGNGSRALKCQQYWDFHFREPANPASADEYREELGRLFRQAVNRQLISDVELGSYLSGGIDSGSITAVAATSFPYLKTFTCGFDLSSASGIELAFDERTRAEAMSYHFKTEHYEMVLKAGDMERCLPRLAWHLEEPRVGQSYPNFYAAQLASKFVKVVLSGGGGDELFGGYPWRYYRAIVNRDFDDYIDKYYLFWQRLASNTELKGLFAPVAPDVTDVWTRDIFRNVFPDREGPPETPEDYVNHSLYFEAKTFLHGLLVVEDKLSMAHGLEFRVPFLDNDLVDFAMNCPVGLKLNNLQEVVRIDENEPVAKQARFFQKTRDGKQILRDVMSGFIPEDVAKAEKQGFSAPDASWFKGDSIDFVRRTLMNGDARIFDYLDRGAVHSLVGQHLDGEHNRRLLIWSLLNVEEVLKQHSSPTAAAWQ